MRRLTQLTFPQLPPFSWPLVLLPLILVVALGLRFHGLDWDSGYGFHPDERSIYMRAGCVYDLLTERPGYEACIGEYTETRTGLPSLSVFLDAERSPLNPHWFPLGSILIYVLVFFRSIIELFADINALDMRYFGRALSALADVGSVFMVYLLGRRIYGGQYGPWVGLLAAALTALAVIHIQTSHFYRPEIFSALLILAGFWAALRMVEKRRLRDSLLLGLIIGLAFAPKVSILPVLLPLLFAYTYRLLDSGNGLWSGVTRDGIGQTLFHALAAGVVALVAFFAVTPYALLDFTNFIGEQAAQANMARNAGLWPFTIQYVDTPAFRYQFHQTAVWGLGLPLGLFAWAGIAFSAAMVWRGSESRRADLLLLAWVVPSILFLESFEVRFQRYYFALIPFMILMGSRLLLWPLVWFQSQTPASFPDSAIQSKTSLRSGVNPEGVWRYLRYTPRGRLCLMAVSVAPLVVVLAATAFYSLAFQRVYANPHPAVAGSRWINENLPDRTVILSDNHWDEFIPELYRYRVWQFPAYEPDNAQKMIKLGEELARAEYLVFYSHRPYVSVTSDPERFPLSANYYQQLFGGELGYRLERTFTSYPELAGVAFVDDPLGRAGLPRPEPMVPVESQPLFPISLGYADDNVVGYDHPQVLLFRNVERLSEDALLLRLVSGRFEPNRRAGLLLSDGQAAVQQRGGTWSEIFDRHSWANRLPALAWLLAVELIYLAALPLALFLFRPLADRGMILARILGLLTVAYVTWLIVSLGWVDFSRTAIVLGLLVVAALSGLALAARRSEMLTFLAQRWRLLLTGEALFLLAFLAFVVIRAYNPDLWHPYRGGEKPMELAYLNAVVRSSLLPPYDPWFAGGYLNYYYWGYFILALPIRLTGIVPTVAFNLAVPLFFALTVTGAYSIVYNLAEGVRRSRSSLHSGDSEAPTNSDRAKAIADADTANAVEEDYGSPIGHTGAESAVTTIGESAPPPEPGPGRAEWVIRSPVTAGLFAGLFVAVVANLDGVVQLVQGTWSKLVGAGGEFPAFDFWRSSRMVPNLENFDTGPLVFWVPEKIADFPDVSWHITEFPFFTFLFSDLHAHMMVIPFTLLVIGLGLNLVVGWRRFGWVWDVAAVAMLSLALGALWLINSWDYPAYLALTLSLVGLAVYGIPGTARTRLTWGVGLAVGIVSISLFAFQPFHQALETFDAGIEASKWRTPFDRYLGIHGLFLFIVGTFLVWQARYPLAQICRWRLFASLRGVSATPRQTDRPVQLLFLRLYLVLGLMAVVYFALAGYWTGAVLLFLLVITGLVAWDVLLSSASSNSDAEPGGRERTYTVFVLLLLGMALAIGVGVDLVRLSGDIGRMNTLFKYYLEAWVLLGLAAAYMLWRLGFDRELKPVNLNRPRLLWTGVVALLILCSLSYTVLGTQARLADRFNDLPPTLDGMAYMEGAVHWEREQPLALKGDAEAIRWLQDNVSGSPVVLEAHTEQYHWGGRIANYTGLPTVLGWPWHQIQQRGVYSDEIPARAGDIREIYETVDLERAQSLLRAYNVRYVVVGQLERIYYPGAGLAKFDNMTEQGTASPVFRNGDVTIYGLELDPSRS